MADTSGKPSPVGSERGASLEHAALAELGSALDAAKARQQSGPSDAAVAAQARERSALGKAWSLAIEMAAAIGVGVFIGWWVDRWFGSAPWGLLGFALLGIATAMWTAIRTGMAMNRAAGQDE